MFATHASTAGRTSARHLLGVVCTALLTSVASAGVGTWTTSGPRTAWTLLAADPRPGGAVFAGAHERLYRSLDGGASWLPVTISGFDQANLDPRRIIFDPIVARRVYAIADGRSVVRSDDDGATWSLIPGDYVRPRPITVIPPTYNLSRMAAAGSRLFVLDTGTLPAAIRYTVDGSTWQSMSAVFGGTVLDFAVDPDAPETIYAAGGALDGSDRGVARSADSGATWTLVQDGLPQDFAGRTVVVDRAQPNRVYVFGTSRSDSTAPMQLYRSTDRGQRWTRLAVPFTSARAVGGELATDPAHPATIFARVAGEAFRSNDDGINWQPVKLIGSKAPLSVAPLPGGRLLAAAQDLGILASDDAGSTWIAANASLPGGTTTRVRSAAGDPYVPFAMSEQTTASFVARRRGGADNVWSTPTAGAANVPLTALGVSATGSGLVLAATGTPGLPNVQSGDHGATWSSLVRDNVFLDGRVDELLASPGSDSTLYAYGRVIVGSLADTRGALFRSSDGGHSWQDVRPAGVYSDFGALAIAASDPKTLYAAGSIYWTTVGVQRTRDGGESWTRLSLPNVASQAVAGIAVNPSDSRDVVVAFRNTASVYRSRDGGETWTAIADPVPAPTVEAIAVDWRAQPPIIFAGTAQGLFAASGDGGVSWSGVEGTASMRVADIRVDRSPDVPQRATLTIATQAGVHELTSAPDGELLPVFRFFNTQTFAHFYTASADERDLVLATLPQFRYEGVAMYAAYAATQGTLPVYRFYDPARGVHVYAVSAATHDDLVAARPDLIDEGVRFHGFRASEPGTVKVHAFVDGSNGATFFTTQDDERDVVRQRLRNFTDTGVAFSAYPASSQQ